MREMYRMLTFNKMQLLINGLKILLIIGRRDSRINKFYIQYKNNYNKFNKQYLKKFDRKKILLLYFN